MEKDSESLYVLTNIISTENTRANSHKYVLFGTLSIINLCVYGINNAHRDNVQRSSWRAHSTRACIETQHTQMTNTETPIVGVAVVDTELNALL